VPADGRDQVPVRPPHGGQDEISERSEVRAAPFGQCDDVAEPVRGIPTSRRLVFPRERGPVLCCLDLGQPGVTRQDGGLVVFRHSGCPVKAGVL
jgi:hypothetical protein